MPDNDLTTQPASPRGSHAAGSTPASADALSGRDHDPGDTTGPIETGVTGAEIVFDGVVKQYPGQGKAAVDGLSLRIPAGETVMFVGPSGCGKTTSLKMINRLIDPTSGHITIGGQDVARSKVDDLRRTIGYVIQGGSLFPHMTVADNVAVVPGLLKWDEDAIAKRVDDLLDMVGLDPERYRDRYPRELSGGQQQRVGVARGLAADPPVILMDEPFGAVDPITRQRLQDEMLSIQRRLRKTIICVTHDIDEALKLGDRILILSEGGKIEQYDTPENILAAPANEFVEDFVGAGSALKSLSLTRISDVEISRLPHVRVGDSVASARELARTGEARLLVVVDERDRPVDLVFADKLRGETVRDLGRDLLTVDRRSTLNDALDAMLTSSHGTVVVTGGRGEYRGVASFEQVMGHIQEAQRRAEEGDRHADATPSPDAIVVANTASDTDFDAATRKGEREGDAR